MPPDCRCVYIVTKMVSSGTIHAPLCRSGLQASTPSAFFTRLRGMAEPSGPLLHKEAVFTPMTLGAGEEDRIFAAHRKIRHPDELMPPTELFWGRKLRCRTRVG